MTGNISATAGSTAPCITVGAGGATLNLNGYRIDISALGDTGVAIAIDTGATSNTTINGINTTTLANAIIITNYSTVAAKNTSAITSSGGTLSISGVTLDNEANDISPCNQSATATEWGTGILLNGVAGATISGNTVDCYQVGISVQNSAIANNGTALISGNNLFWNVYYQPSGTQPNTNSAGLVLSNSSGWTVSGNTIEYNGSTDAGGTCVSNPPSLISCAFGLQVINGSSNNSISSNTQVSGNFGGGIYTGPATSRNTISGNTALSNGSASETNPTDLWDDAPAHSNHWHHNTCATVGGSVPSNAC